MIFHIFFPKTAKYYYLFIKAYKRSKTFDAERLEKK